MDSGQRPGRVSAAEARKEKQRRREAEEKQLRVEMLVAQMKANIGVDKSCADVMSYVKGGGGLDLTVTPLRGSRALPMWDEPSPWAPWSNEEASAAQLPPIQARPVTASPQQLQASRSMPVLSTGQRAGLTVDMDQRPGTAVGIPLIASPGSPQRPLSGRRNSTWGKLRGAYQLGALSFMHRQPKLRDLAPNPRLLQAAHVFDTTHTVNVAVLKRTSRVINEDAAEGRCNGSALCFRRGVFRVSTERLLTPDYRWEVCSSCSTCAPRGAQHAPESMLTACLPFALPLCVTGGELEGECGRGTTP